MTAMEWAEKVINGVGGMNDFERYECAVWHCSNDRVAAVYWALRCLANPNCDGSEEMLAAINEMRRVKSALAGKEQKP